MSGNDPLPGLLSSPVFRPDDRRANLRPARSPGRTFAAALMAALVVAFAVIALTRPAVPDLKIQNPTVAAATALAETDLPGDSMRAAAGPDSNAPVRLAALVEEERAPFVRSVVVKRGSTLMNTLLAAGAGRDQAYEAIAALEEIFNPRTLRAGQAIEIGLRPGADDSAAPELMSVTIPINPEQKVAAIRRDGGGFEHDEIAISLERDYVRAEGTIEDSLFLASERAGVPARLIMDMIRVFSWDVDFQRDIREGDKFEILYERFRNDAGEAVKNGEIVLASMTLSGKEIRFYRHVVEDGTIDYFDANGQSVRKALLRTPVDGARLSSRYGRRRDPILGYTKMHRGLDFAAPSGTPIMAAGDGMVESAGRNGAYGLYIRIRHNSTYKTAYAHLKSLARGVRTGTRVTQGQTIGFVGSTGRSTGPHLHYEVLEGGQQTNPLNVKLPTGKKLEGDELAGFETHRDGLESILSATPALVAAAD